MSFAFSANLKHTRIPAATALLALLWLGGCRQIPTAPSPEEVPAIQAQPAAKPDEPRKVLEQIQRTAPSTPAEPVQIPPSAPRQVATPLMPQGAQSAPWISASQRPQWLQTCLALHQLDDMPKIERTVIPEYPSKLLMDGLEGQVMVLLHISGEGKLLHHLTRPGSPPEMVKSTVAAIKKWKFSPITRNGQPADTCFVQNFRYRF